MDKRKNIQAFMGAFIRAFIHRSVGVFCALDYLFVCLFLKGLGVVVVVILLLFLAWVELQVLLYYLRIFSDQKKRG